MSGEGVPFAKSQRQEKARQMSVVEHGGRTGFQKAVLGSGRPEMNQTRSGTPDPARS